MSPRERRVVLYRMETISRRLVTLPRAHHVARLTAVLGLSFGAVSGSVPPGRQQDPPAVVDFKERVARYAALHQRLEAQLPKLPKDATPEQIAQSQSALAAAIRAARSGARQGELFTPGMTLYIRQLFKGIFVGQRARELRESIMDEYPGNIRLTVDGLYPSSVPIANMPPDILKALPPLPEELEYRFVGPELILFDQHAQIVPDFILRALPGS